MKAILIILLMAMSARAQEPVYVAGEDEISWVLQSGKGEKILGQYEMEYSIGGMTANMLDSIKAFLNDSTIKLFDPSNGEHDYTKLNTEVIFESHISRSDLDLDFSYDPFAQFIFDELLLDFKKSGTMMYGGETYLILFQMELHYIPGTPLIQDEEFYPSDEHIVLKIRQSLR